MMIIQANSEKPPKCLGLDNNCFIGCLFHYRISKTYCLILGVNNTNDKRYIKFTVLTSEGKLYTFPVIKNFLEIIG